MTAFSMKYMEATESLDAMTTQSSNIETAVDDLMRRVNTALADWSGDGSVAYYDAQRNCSKAISDLKNKLSRNITNCKTIMGNYQTTDRAQANNFSQ